MPILLENIAQLLGHVLDTLRAVKNHEERAVRRKHDGIEDGILLDTARRIVNHEQVADTAVVFGKELEEESEISEEPSENSEESEESDVSEVSDEPSESNEDEIVIQVSAESVAEPSESEPVSSNTTEYSAPTSVRSNTVVTRTPSTDTGVAYKPAESPATGDTTVPAVLIVISAAASGIAFVLFRKCTGR